MKLAFTKQNGSKKTGQFRKGYMLVGIFIMVVFLCMIKERVYADSPYNTGLAESETELLKYKTADVSKSNDISEKDQDLKENNHIEVREYDFCENQPIINKLEHNLKGKAHALLISLLFPLILLVLRIPTSRLYLPRKSEKKLDSLLEEYSTISDRQHRYYAYCVEELLREEYWATPCRSSKIMSIQKDVSNIYAKRIENRLRVEAVKKDKVNHKTAIRTLKRILNEEKEHLHRLECHLRAVKDENAKKATELILSE